MYYGKSIVYILSYYLLSSFTQWDKHIPYYLIVLYLAL